MPSTRHAALRARRWLPALRMALVIWLLPWHVVAHAASDSSESGMVVIVAQESPISRISRDELTLIFKARKRYWEEGLRIQPVNLPAAHLLRRTFSTQILGSSPEELDDYWRDMYFHGVQPPYVFASEEAVIRFVSSTPGAIGYVSSCATDHRIKVVMHMENGVPCQH